LNRKTGTRRWHEFCYVEDASGAEAHRPAITRPDLRFRPGGETDTCAGHGGFDRHCRRFFARPFSGAQFLL